MKKKFLTSLIISTLAFCGMIQADAQSAWYPNCWYVSGYAGPALHREMDIRFDNPTSDLPPAIFASYPLITNYRTGYGVGGAIGAVFCRNWRLEIEGYFRNFNGKRVAVTQDAEAASCCSAVECDLNLFYNPSTHYRSFSLMANGFYDFCLCECVSWYVGGGIGPSWVEYQIVPLGINSPPLAGINFTFSAKTSEVRFSYQLMTGITYKFCNHISATVGYRLWGTTKDTDASGSFYNITYSVSERRAPLVNSVEFGLRYAF